mgnify:CR=1 FL=1
MAGCRDAPSEPWSLEYPADWLETQWVELAMKKRSLNKSDALGVFGIDPECGLLPKRSPLDDDERAQYSELLNDRNDDEEILAALIELGAKP